jgi:polyhydroxyalkanoate synthase
MTANNGLPMVDKSKFRLGENVATSQGKVVYAEDHLELIQFAPKTDKVWKVPVFIVPPQINKFYIWDLAPGRSIVEYLVSQGHQVFVVSWRNPSDAQADWDLERCPGVNRASAAACEIAGVIDVEGSADTAGPLRQHQVPEPCQLSRARASRGRDPERAFAWPRPNDLIWAYW